MGPFVRCAVVIDVHQSMHPALDVPTRGKNSVSSRARIPLNRLCRVKAQGFEYLE